MKWLVRLEECLLFIFSICALYLLGAEWWLYALLLLGPDISMLAYAAGNRAGAVAYNIFHHRGIAALVAMAGFASGSSTLQLAGVVLFGHSSMDRAFGYGLKYFSGFGDTHLGKIGGSRSGQ